MSHLVCMGRHTITGVLATEGRQFVDWTADYRLFAKERVAPQSLFGVVEREILSSLAPEPPLVVALDDSLLRKRGKKIPGAGWLRDPLGPPFHTNFVWGQRVLQLSAALPFGEGACPARMIPVALCTVPKAKRPRQGAPAEALAEYARAKKAVNINLKAVEELEALRGRVDRCDGARRVWVVADGNFTNSTMLKHLPDRTVCIGRVRRDARLYLPPAPKERRTGAGRKRSYGDRAPTPDAFLRDASVPWETAKVYAVGKAHDLKYKTLGPVLWRAAGADRPLRLIVIAPLTYLLRKGGPKDRREPAFLICTDPEAAVERILQAYNWRWDIEVNFRDEKQIIGAGQAQVRSPASVQNAPAFAVACYALLLLAAAKAFGPRGRPDSLPAPAWRKDKEGARATTRDLIQQLRFELWGRAIHGENFSGFESSTRINPKPMKFLPDLKSAVLYAS